MFSIKEISFFDYLIYFSLKLPPMGIYYIRHSQVNEGVLLGSFVDEKLVGISIIALTPRPSLNYIFVTEGFRGQGIGKKLIINALSHVKSKNLPNLEARVVLHNENAETVDHILRKTGFIVSDTATIIRYTNDERCSKGWTRFMEQRGRRICRALEKRGFKTLSFSEASGETFDKLKALIGTEFPANLNPFNFITNKMDRLVPEYSFITIRDDEPVAFVTVTTADDRTLVFQQLSTSFRHRSNGVFLLPFAAFMDKFLDSDNYNKVSAVIYDNNDRMQRLVRSFIGPLAESLKTQTVYSANTAIFPQ